LTDQTAMEIATKRLAHALEVLDAAIDRRLEIERNDARLSEQLHALGADRSRLAAELDAQTARAHRLEDANREIARRLDAAMDNIRSVLDRGER
jgi:septal ring factor EnvC (AmiA/AmiB activator)